MHRKKVFLVLLMAGMAMVMATGSAFGGGKKEKKVVSEPFQKAYTVYGSIRDYIGDKYEIIWAHYYGIYSRNRNERPIDLKYDLFKYEKESCQREAANQGYSHVYFAIDHYRWGPPWPDGTEAYVEGNVICLVKKKKNR